MLKNRKWLSAAAGIALVMCAAAPALSGSVRTESAGTSASAIGLSAVENAAVTFVRAMRDGDVATVWMFASEEEQDAFGTEAEAYAANAEDFPVLKDARPIEFLRSWQEGDTPFVELSLVDNSGGEYRATMGFWLDDAGDWKLVSCDLKSVSDRVAAR
jgi:hypothetical protein